jgi:hypothetical protein
LIIFPAAEIGVYDGRLFQVLKKALRDRADWDRDLFILIVSAKYGVIRPGRVIETYEERLTAKSALLRRDRFARQLRLAVSVRAFRAIRVDLGRAYRSTLPDLDTFFAPTPIDWASGGIGIRNAQTRAWVLDQLGDGGEAVSGGTPGRRSSHPGPRSDSRL